MFRRNIAWLATLDKLISSFFWCWIFQKEGAFLWDGHYTKTLCSLKTKILPQILSKMANFSCFTFLAKIVNVTDIFAFPAKQWSCDKHFCFSRKKLFMQQIFLLFQQEICHSTTIFVFPAKNWSCDQYFLLLLPKKWSDGKSLLFSST